MRVWVVGCSTGEEEDLVVDARRVLADLVPIERNARTNTGRWLLARLRPYRTLEDKIDGVVITFVDVTERTEAEAAWESRPVIGNWSVRLGDVELFDCTANAACTNPVCRCRTTEVVMRPRTSGLRMHEIIFDLDTRRIDEPYRKRASNEDLTFGERLLSDMDEADFDLLGRLHYRAKNRMCEQASPSDIKARSDFDEIEGSSLVQAYNDILPFGDTFRVTVDGADYVALDQYCLRPSCRCTDAVLNLIPTDDLDKTVPSAGAVRVGYEAMNWEPIAGEPLPCDVPDLRHLMETASPYGLMRARHKRLRAIYAHCRRRELEALQAVLGAGTVGRNDICPCGSGKKFKKCCLGKAAASAPAPKPVDRMQTSTIISAIKAPRSP